MNGAPHPQSPLFPTGPLAPPPDAPHPVALALAPPRRFNPDQIIYLVLLLLPSLLFIRPLITGSIPYFMDPLMYFFPQRFHAARLLAGGELPLWNRCIMGGMPLFENPQSALAYPFNWPSLVFPGGFWFTFPLTLQLGLYGALTAWAMRRFGLGRFHAAWIGAMALAGEYGWSRLQSGNFMNVLPWLPLWLGSAWAYAESRRMRWLAAGALAVSMMVLGGAHQLAFYSLAAFVLIAIIQIAITPGLRARWAAFMATTIALGLLISAPGWLPALGFISETSRAEGINKAGVLEGSYDSLEQFMGALDVNPLLLKWTPGKPWDDAEDSSTVGTVVIVLAMLIPASGRRRRLWIGCWIAIAATLALAWRPVVGWLFDIFPASGLFHGPRRWLGITQWLLLVAAGLNLPTLALPLIEGNKPAWWANPRVRRLIAMAFGVVVGVVLIAIDARLSPAARIHATLVVAIITTLILIRDGYIVAGRRFLERGGLAVACLLLAHATWVSVDRMTIPVGELLHPETQPLLLTHPPAPGERFFTHDWQRAASYDFRRPDLLDWALPNLAMLWGLEDIGGYEPAQSRRYRETMQRLHQAEPWRQISPNHFGLIGILSESPFLNEANVTRAILPRWGLPLYFQSGQPHVRRSIAPLLLPSEMQLRALILQENAAATPTLTLSNLSARDSEQRQLHGAHPLALQDDIWTSPPAQTSPSLDNSDLRMLRGDFTSPADHYEEWAVYVPQGATLIELFLWNPRFTSNWRPLETRQIATLAEHRAAPARAAWFNGRSKIPVPLLDEKHQANRIEFTVQLAPLASSTPAPAAGEFILHDAYWPGWRAWVDGVETEIQPHGMWRKFPLAPGKHSIVMEYRPPLIRISLWMTLLGAVCMIGMAQIHRRLDRRPVPPSPNP